MILRFAGALLAALTLLGCARVGPAPLPAIPAEHEVATFAGGCFWCMEPPFDEIDGVLATTSGYTGGHTRRPTYEEVATDLTGHAEAVQVLYDPRKVSYERLLEVFWRNVDPTVSDRQFCDTGSAYRSAIFYHTDEQRRLALASKERIARIKRFPEEIVTEIVPATEFWPAESYHQDFYLRNPLRYMFYRTRCGRDARLEELWGKPDESGKPGAAVGAPRP